MEKFILFYFSLLESPSEETRSNMPFTIY